MKLYPKFIKKLHLEKKPKHKFSLIEIKLQLRYNFREILI